MNSILALDASGKQAGACVLLNGQLAFEQTLDEGLTHSETLLPLAQKALAACGLRAQDVSLYAITAGPGSFTGLRIGMALVKGMALPYGTPLAPVSTLEAAAYAAGQEGLVLPTQNARRGEVYWAAFRCGAHCQRLVPDSAGPVAQVQSFCQKLGESVIVVGDGATMCYTISDSTPLVTLQTAALPLARGAAAVAYQMLQRKEIVQANMVHPFYLRLSQAERERREKLERAAGEKALP